ncbi:MAG: hypothetical protein F6K22_07335 [Okeania sp. SIO2F4]|uniref:hypothetical protein n=1 Tax=Okeania sp. SIO2F4 TaxID=2607790 RepID=UPI00142A6B8A|nr:hypothetical protein [Okeania sp. SIO2F4]NES02673.1 hypothetical protein [Okeania sp. SIO2F4]
MIKALKNPKSGVYRIFHGTTIPTQKTFKLIEQWENGWKKISDSTIAKIIEYYAFDAPESNDRAKDTFKTFAPIGISNWVKEAVQYVEKEPTDNDPKETLASIDEKLSLIQQTVQELSQQLPESENQEE